jgi:S1-C subfamily serine protease
VRIAVAVVLGSLVLATACSGGDDEASESRELAQSPATTRTVERDQSSGGSAWDRIPEIVEQVDPSVVAVAVEGQAGRGEGSGVVWDDEGLIVTNEHVVAGAAEVEVVLASGARLDA